MALLKTAMTRHIFCISSAFIAIFFLPFAAQAAINKCVGADGKVVFSDQACNVGQAATEIKAPAKSPLKAATKAPERGSQPLNAADLPSEGATIPNSNLQQYDTLCAEDRRLLEIAARRVKDTIGNENFQLNKARVDKRCNPQMRLAAAEKDVEGLAIECKSRREEMQSNKNLPKRPPGYADRSQEIASAEAWLKSNCN